MKLLPLLAFSIHALAFEIPIDQEWLSPNDPNNDTIFHIGQTIPIVWSATLFTFFGLAAPSIDVQNADLWVSGFEQPQYRHLVASGVNINGSTRLVQWTVNLSHDELSHEHEWTFVFTKLGADPFTHADQIPSPSFFIADSGSIVSTSSSVATIFATSFVSTLRSTSVQASASSSIASSRLASLRASQSAVLQATATTKSIPTSTSSSSPSSNSNVGIGGVVGILIGAMAGMAILIATGWLIARAKGQRYSDSYCHKPSPNFANEKIFVTPGDGPKLTYKLHELPSNISKAVYEFRNISELHGSCTMPAELSGSQVDSKS